MKTSLGGCRAVAVDSEGDGSGGDKGCISEVKWKGVGNALHS